MKLTTGLDKKADGVSPEIIEPPPPPYVSEKPPAYNVENPATALPAPSTTPRRKMCSKTCAAASCCVVIVLPLSLLLGIFFNPFRSGGGWCGWCDVLYPSYKGHAVMYNEQGSSYIVPTLFVHGEENQFAVLDNTTNECFFLTLNQDYEQKSARLQYVTREPRNATAVFTPEPHRRDNSYRCPRNELYPFCGGNVIYQLRAITGDFTFGDKVNYILRNKLGDITTTWAP